MLFRSEQAVLLGSGSAIGVQQLALSQMGPAAVGEQAPRPGNAVAQRASAELTLPQMERQALINALTLSDGNVTRAARELGISRDTLRYRIEKYGLDAQARPLARDTR